jgi:hypothetical protein
MSGKSPRKETKGKPKSNQPKQKQEQEQSQEPVHDALRPKKKG